MIHLTLPLAAIALTFVQACSDPTPPIPPDIEHAGSCGAQELQELVGQIYDLNITTQITEPFRVIRPGQFVTLDYNPDRTNIDLDADDVIIRIWCG